MDTITSNTHTWLEIDPTGARVHQLYLNGSQILWAGTRPDGGQGSTHPCIPNFNPADGLPQHGPARKAAWKKISTGTYGWQMEAIDGVYPPGLMVDRTFKLTSNSLTVTNVVKNTSSHVLPINIGEHPYFSLPQGNVQDVSINGRYIGDNPATGGTDYVDCLKENRINIPGLGIIKLTQTGYTKFALWSLPQAKYVCVEPIQMLPPDPQNFSSDAFQLPPSETQVFSYTLSI